MQPCVLVCIVWHNREKRVIFSYWGTNPHDVPRTNQMPQLYVCHYRYASIKGGDGTEGKARYGSGAKYKPIHMAPGDFTIIEKFPTPALYFDFLYENYLLYTSTCPIEWVKKSEK